MRKLRLLPLFLVLALSCAALAGQPPAATAVVDDAVNLAKSEHKGVIVIFHASWCGWCKQLDKTLEVPEFKSIIDKDFIVLHVTVSENAAHKADENPGGAELMAKLGGEGAGLPYFASMDSTGKQVADSKVIEGAKPTLQNMGYPTQKVEITHFLEMLKLSNPALTAADAATLQKVLDARAKEITAAQHH